LRQLKLFIIELVHKNIGHVEIATKPLQEVRKCYGDILGLKFYKIKEEKIKRLKLLFLKYVYY